MTDFKATVKMVSVQESPLPQWYLGLAFDAAKACRERERGHAGTLNAVLLTMLAAEAIVNRLLEPLIRKDWNKVEHKPMATKWARLSREIDLKPELNAERAPLKALADLVQLRNDLVHFKFSPNLTRAEQELPAIHKRTGSEGFSSTIQFPNRATVRIPVVQDSGLPERLDPGRAWGYFTALVEVVRPVLAKYPKDSFGTRDELLDVVREVDQYQVSGSNAP